MSLIEFVLVNEEEENKKHYDVCNVFYLSLIQYLYAMKRIKNEIL